MRTFQMLITCLLTLCLIGFSVQEAHAEVTYVTDAGGYAYDESRAVTNLAPAIALGTVVVVAIIAVAVQNSHHGSSSYHTHFGSSNFNSHSGQTFTFHPSYNSY